jgi:hypothetical protein
MYHAVRAIKTISNTLVVIAKNSVNLLFERVVFSSATLVVAGLMLIGSLGSFSISFAIVILPLYPISINHFCLIVA